MAKIFLAILVITSALSFTFGFALEQPSGEATYERVSPRQTGHITLTPLGAGLYHVTGFAFWGEHRGDMYPVHIGELDFTAELDGDTLEHSEPTFTGRPHRVVLRFAGGMLHVTEEGFSAVHGLNVTFGGTYRQRGEG